MPNTPQLRPIPQDDAPPSLWAPTEGAMNMAGAPPDMGVTPTPKVSRIPTQGEQNIAHDQARLEKVQWNQDHPWGTPENHPGKLGKVAHVFSELGNIAGNIVAPGVMANIPGTQMNMRQEEGQMAKRVGAEQTAESENQARGAQQAKTEEDTALEPGKAASQEALQDAETAEKQQSLDMGPSLIQGHAHAVSQAIKNRRDPATDPLVQQYEDSIQRLQKQTTPKDEASKTIDILGPDHKEHMMGWNAKTGKFDVDMGLKGEKPTQAPGITLVIPNAEGGGTVQRLGVGGTVAPGAMTAGQFGAGNAADVKAGKADQRATANLDSELNLMRQFAANPSPTNDAAMLMHYIGATKPESMGKIRLNDRELKLFGGTRSSLGDVEALMSKLANGQSLTPKQRSDMVNTMTMIDNAAKRDGGGGGTQMFTDGSTTYNIPKEHIAEFKKDHPNAR